ncbi:MAG: lysophospholipid acyltransferase family protein [Planctomycetota bacterium]|jgi:KDO2-lipid IV(A) lauroyltransferase
MSAERGILWMALCFVQYIIVRTVELVVQIAPDETAGMIGSLFGYITFRIDGRHRRRAIENLRHAFERQMDERRIRRLARESLVHVVTCMVEVLKFPRVFSRADWHRHVQFRRFSGIAESRDRGAGIIFVTGHFGNWEASAHVMAMCGFPVHSVYRSLDNPFFDAYVRSARERAGMKAISRRGGLREMVRVLRDRGYLGLVIDQDTKEDPVFVDFFGRKASMFKTPAALALRTGAAIIPGVALRTERPFRYEMYAGPPIAPSETGDYERDIEATSQNIASAFEKWIRKYPEQWLWAHNRWKTQPPEAAETPAEKRQDD